MSETLNPGEKKKRHCIKGLEELGALAHVRPEQLWSDKGTSFPCTLMTRFKKSKASCKLIRSMGKEQHRVKQNLVENKRWNPKSFEEYEESGCLSHLLFLLMIEFEEELSEAGKMMPPVKPRTVHSLVETDAERQTEFSQELRRSKVSERQDRRRQTIDLGARSTPEQGEIRVVNRKTGERREDRDGLHSHRRARSRTRSSRKFEGENRLRTRARFEGNIEEKWETIPETVGARSRSLSYQGLKHIRRTRTGARDTSMREERAQKPRCSQRAQKVEWVTGRGNQHRVKDAQRRRILAVSRTRTRSRERSRTRRGRSASTHMRFRPNTQEVGKNYARARHVRAKSRTPRRRVERRQGRQYTPPRVHVRRD